MRNPTVKINGINLRERFKAVLTDRHCVQPPVPKTIFQDIPGADGAEDLSTTLTGRPIYERRQITMNFQGDLPANQWPGILSEIMGEFHGKQGKIIFGDDEAYYYLGRMEVSNYERARTWGKFTITANAEPYKYELLSSLEPWKWGPFSFRTGVIRNYGNLAVNGPRTLDIPGTERWVVPVFHTKGTIQVSFEGKTYQLETGTSKIYAIAIKPGINRFQFSGTGTVSVEYRGGML